MRQFQAIHWSRHTNIGEQDVNGLRTRFAYIQSGTSVFRLEGPEARFFQNVDRNRAQKYFVFCDNDDEWSFRSLGWIYHHKELWQFAKVPPLCQEPYANSGRGPDWTLR